MNKMINGPFECWSYDLGLKQPICFSTTGTKTDFWAIFLPGGARPHKGYSIFCYAFDLKRFFLIASLFTGESYYWAKLSLCTFFGLGELRTSVL